MLRVYKNFLYQVLTFLLYAREKDLTYKQANDYVYKDVYKAGKLDFGNCKLIKQALFNFYLQPQSACGNRETLDEMIDQCAHQLAGTDEPHDRDLIDMIVRVLSLPYARNVLAGDAIKHLRNAILLPEEIITLKAQLTKEMSCASCSHRFLPTEMSTYHSQGGPNRGGAFYCTRCHKPQYIAHDSDSTQSLSIDKIKGLKTALLKKHGIPSPEAEAPHIAEVLGNMNEIVYYGNRLPPLAGAYREGG